MAIDTMKQLRDRLLHAFEELEDGKIDAEKALTLAKLSDTVVAGLKSELQYCILTSSEPNIPFYGESSGKLLDPNITKKLL